MFYRSYGLALVIVAVLVVAERYRGQLPMSASIAGLILLIDLPLRFLGNFVPWRTYETSWWPISPYRGSHVCFIPTWLFGMLGLVIGAATFVSPPLHAFLQRKEVDEIVKPPVKNPEPEKPIGKLEVSIEEVVPSDGNRFRVTFNNGTGLALETVEASANQRSARDEKPRLALLNHGGRLAVGEKQVNELIAMGRPDWVYVHVRALTRQKREFMVEAEWKRK